MKIFTLFFLFVLLSCSSKKITHYQGYIIDSNNEPVKNIHIEGRHHSKEIATTNEEGFFKMKLKENWIDRFLYVKKNGVIIDSIQVLRTHPEYGPEFYFVNGRKDTFLIEKVN